MIRITTPKRDRVARGIRAAILRGDYTDGFALSQGKLAAEYGVNRQVVWCVLAALEREGYVSSDERNRFHVNASYTSRQLQLTRNRLELVERYTSRLLVRLGVDPSDLDKRLDRGNTGRPKTLPFDGGADQA